MRVGLVCSRFNTEITTELKRGALEVLKQTKGLEVILLDVPGAIEIPLACQDLLKKQKCLGVVALGAVIRGETSHYDVVCDAVREGVMRVMLDQSRPIALGVLTCENEDQAWARLGGDFGHKGKEAAEVVLEMIQTLGLVKKKKSSKSKQ